MATAWHHIVIFALFVSAPALAGVIHVPEDAPTIQGGIDLAADGDEVIVAHGVYGESIDFTGKAITLRSAAGAEVTTILPGLQQLQPAVVCRTGEGPGTVLEGFTITEGYSGEGGGMKNIGTSPTVRDCIFTGNWAGREGGGMFNEGGGPVITGCIFQDNYSGHSGGALSNDHASVTLVGCVFVGNTTVQHHGGAIHNIHSDLTVIGCTFVANIAQDDGGAISNEYFCDHTFEIFDSLLVGNTGGFGGAVSGACGTIAGCTVVANRNRASHFGAIIHGGEFLVLGSIIWGNDALAQISAAATVRFSTVEGGWTGHGSGNIDSDPMFAAEPDDGGDGFGDDFFTQELDESINDFLGDQRLQAGSPAIDAGHNWALPQDAFDLDGDGDTQELLPSDLDGNPRFTAGPGGPDTGCGVPAVVDMGAYEHQSGPAMEVVPGDIDGNGSVGTADLLELLESWGITDWGNTDDPCALADLDLDGAVGLSDLVLLLEKWAG